MTISLRSRTVVQDHSRAERRNTRRRLHQAKEYQRVSFDRGRSGPSALLLSGPVDGGGFAPQANHWWIRLLARLFSSRLDRRLAAGVLPESSPLTAARAERLVSFPVRSALAQCWQGLLAEAAAPPGNRCRSVPLCRERITGSRPEVAAMVDALSMQLPVPAGGVAAAGRLLTDGTGPLYNPSCPTDLSDTVRTVVGQLDPATALLPSG